MYAVHLWWRRGCSALTRAAVVRNQVKALMRRALAYTQQHEHDRAVADYTTALQYTPDHLTPVEQPAWVPLCRIRRALALESLNRLDSLETAIADLEVARNCVLPADMLRLATDGMRRISRSIDLDRALRKEHPADEGLMRSDQLLRLHFSSALPTQLCLGEPLSLSVYVANELGCWRREDFANLFHPSETMACSTTPEGDSLRLPLAVTVHAWPPREAVLGEGKPGVRLELLGLGKNIAEAEADAASCFDGSNCRLARVASLTEAGKVTLVLRLVADQDATAAPTAIQLQIATSSDVQLQRDLVGVLSMPIALQQSASQCAATYSALQAEVAAQAAAVHAEACRELVVSYKADREPVERGVAGDWRLMAAESGAYLGIGGKLWDSSWNMAAFLVEDYCTANAMITHDRPKGENTSHTGGGLVAGRRVLELGAGTGVLGSLCAKLGAASVTVTDLATSVPLIELNLSLNFGCAPQSSSDAFDATQCEDHVMSSQVIPVAMALPWGEPLEQDVIEQIGGLPCKGTAAVPATFTGAACSRTYRTQKRLTRVAAQVIVCCYVTLCTSHTFSLFFW